MDDLTKTTLSDRLTELLGSRIASGDLTGSVTAGDLIEQYSVSRTTVREAVDRLAAKGLVLSRAGVGTRVTDRSGWDLLDADVLRWLGPFEPDLAVQARRMILATAELDGGVADVLRSRLGQAALA